MKYIKLLKESLISWSMKIINHAWIKTGTDWSESDLCKSRRVGEGGDWPGMWSHPDLLEPIMKGRYSDIEMSDHERSKSSMLRFMNIEIVLYLIRQV
jgi:hypothetical protein